MGLSVFLITCLTIFAYLWKVVAAKTGSVVFSPAQLLWYIAFNEWVLISTPDTEDEMEEDLRSGRLAYFLPRPLSYLGATFVGAMGTLCANLLVLGGVTFLFTWWQAGSLPFQPIGLLVAVFFGVAAGCLAVIFRMLIGVSAFWLQEVSPFFWIWEKLLFMLGGLMLPLSLYPDWMQWLAYCTPFPAILGERSALALDFNGQAIAWLTLSIVGWSVLATICLRALYRRGLRILNVEGG